MSSTAAETQAQICAICQCECTGAEATDWLPCGHQMHKACIDDWTKVTNNGVLTGLVCPSCKTPVEGVQLENVVTRVQPVEIVDDADITESPAETVAMEGTAADEEHAAMEDANDASMEFGDAEPEMELPSPLAVSKAAPVETMVEDSDAASADKKMDRHCERKSFATADRFGFMTL